MGLLDWDCMVVLFLVLLKNYLFVLIARVSRDHSLVVVHRLQIAVVLVAEHGEFYAYGLRSCTRV